MQPNNANLSATDLSELIATRLNHGSGHNILATYALPIDFSIEYVCILV